MSKYYINISIAIRLFLMGKLLMSKTIYLPIPPIEKGVTEAVESLTEEVYDYARNVPDRVPEVEDLRLELVMENASISAHYKKQIVDKKEVIDSKSTTLDDRIKFSMVSVERELSEILTHLSEHLYE